MPNVTLVQTESGIWVEQETLAMVRAGILGRLDFPLAFTAAPLVIATLGDRPRKDALLNESTKGWAATAQRAISDRLASVRLLVYAEQVTQEGTVEIEYLDDHPLQLVLDRPGPIFSRHALLWLTAWHLGATGEAYWQRLNDGIGVTRELWPIPPDRVEILAGGPNVIRGYRVTDGFGRAHDLTPDELVHFWRPDPRDLYTGLGSLAPQSVEWDADRYRAESIKEHFRHNAVPPVVLKGQADAMAPGATAKNDFEAEWRNRYHRRSGSSQGVPAFVPPGWDLQELNALGQMTELTQLGASGRDHILQSYGVPTSVLGGSNTDQNRATAETNQFVFDRNTVLPIATLIQSALDQQLARSYDDRLRVRFEDFVADDKEFTLRREQQDLALKVRSVRQVLRDRGADPEDAPWGELPVGSLADAPYTGDEQFGEDISDVEDDGRSSALSRASNPVGIARLLWDRNIATERKHVGRFQRAMQKVFEAQRLMVIERLASILPRSQRIEPSDLLDIDAEDLFELEVEPLRALILKSGIKEARKALGLPPEFQLTPRMVELLEREAVRMRIAVNATTLAKIGRALAAGVADGESVDQIAKRIDPIFRNRKRSRTIARTEVGKANQQGQLEGFDSSGLVEKKRWNSSIDEKVRDSHQINGQVVGLRDEFELANGVMAQHPLDPSLPAADLINCRCFVSPVIDGEDEPRVARQPEKRKLRGTATRDADGRITGMIYEEI